MDRNDINYHRAEAFYRNKIEKETFVTSIPVLVEAWLLIEARLGAFAANKLWESILEGVFEILELDQQSLKDAFEIEQKYHKAGFGIVDATCFAICEKYNIQTVFTFDRKHFNTYKPRFFKFLQLVPA